MKLLSPTLCMIHTGKVKKDCALEFEDFLLCRLYALEGVLEDLIHLFHSEVLSIEGLKTMVRDTAPHLMEEILTFLECMEKVLIVIDLDTRDLRKFLNILTILLRFLHNHSLVWTPCRKDFYAKRIILDLLVILKGVSRIISSTYDLYLESLHQFLTSVLRSLQLSRTLIIDFSRSLRLENLINAEYP